MRADALKRRRLCWASDAAHMQSGLTICHVRIGRRVTAMLAAEIF
jgi:hypothetical protein